MWLEIVEQEITSFLVLCHHLCCFFSRRRRLRVRASSTSDADFLASLTQLMQDRNGMLLSPPPARPRSSSSSLQRSLSSSPSRQELREGGGLPGRSRSPSSFSGSPPTRHAHTHDRPGVQGQWSHATKGKGLLQEGKGSDKVKRWLRLTRVTELEWHKA